MSQNKIMRIGNIVFMFLLFCLTSKAEIRNDTIKSFRINIDNNTSNIELKKIVLKQLVARSGDTLNLSDIFSIEFLGAFNLDGLKKCLIYKIKLSPKLPSVWHKSLALIVDSFHNGYLIDLDLIELIKLKQESEDYFFAGRYKNRYGYGYFRIFKFRNNIMNQIFESRDPVSNFSLDCESYEHDDLKLQNIDLNNDGYLDLKFSGIKNFYCKGLEQYGRDEKKPIKKEKVTFMYCFNKENFTWQKEK